MIRETIYRASSLDPAVLHDLQFKYGRRISAFTASAAYGGTHEDVSYRVVWCDGQHLVWILQSPMIGHFELALGAACDGDRRTTRDAGHMGYDIPPTWRYRDPADTRTFADRIGEHE